MITHRIELWIRLYGRKTKLDNWWSLPSCNRVKALLEIADLDYIYGNRLKLFYEYDQKWSYEWDIEDIVDELNIMMLMNGEANLPKVHRVDSAEFIDMMLVFSGSAYSPTWYNNGTVDIVHD